MTASRGIGRGRISGGRNPGGGRPFGSRNRKSRELATLMDEKKQILPAPFLLSVINDPDAPLRDKIVAANSAAPYVHIRLSPKNPPILSESDLDNLSDEALVARLEGEIRKLPVAECAAELADKAEQVLAELPSLSLRRQEELSDRFSVSRVKRRRPAPSSISSQSTIRPSDHEGVQVGHRERDSRIIGFDLRRPALSVPRALRTADR